MRKRSLILHLAGALAVGFGARPVQAQAEPVAADSGIAVPRFWHELGDTALDRLVAEALRANQDVRAAEARVKGARAARLSAALDLGPIVTAGAGYTRQRLAAAGFPGATGTLPNQDVWDVGVNAGWEVDVFGRLRRSLKAESQLLSAAGEDVRGTQVAVVAELAQAYFDLRGAQERLEVATRNAENQRRTLDLTRQRLDAGRGTAFDTERAQAQLAFTRASIPGLEAAVAAAQYRIGVLVGRPPAAVAAELRDPCEQPSLPDSVAVGNRDSIVALRPEVVAARRRLAAEQAFLGAAKADYLPRFTVGATAGYASSALDGLGDRGTFRYAVGPSLSWPLLDLGHVKAGVRAASARREEAAARYDRVVLEASEELENALVGYRTARARLEAITDAAASSARAAELARLRFTEGVADFLQVLDAERTQLDAESQLAQGRADAAAAYARLYRALGGVWPSPERGG